MSRHRIIVEDEALPDADVMALKKSLNALRPIREYRLRSAEREYFREKKKLQSISEEIQDIERRIEEQDLNEAQQRRALSDKNQGRRLSLKDLQNWAREEKTLMTSTSEMAAEREHIYQKKEEQLQTIEQRNREMLSCNLEIERLKIMLEQIAED